MYLFTLLSCTNMQHIGRDTVFFFFLSTVCCTMLVLEASLASDPLNVNFFLHPIHQKHFLWKTALISINPVPVSPVLGPDSLPSAVV